MAIVSPLVRQANERSDRSNLVEVKEVLEWNADCMYCQDMKCTQKTIFNKNHTLFIMYLNKAVTDL